MLHDELLDLVDKNDARNGLDFTMAGHVSVDETYLAAVIKLALLQEGRL